MKKIFYSLLLMPVILLSSYSTDEIDCESFFPTVEGTTLEYTYYDEKNKPTGYSKQTVKNVKDYGSGIEVTMVLETTDKKGEKPYSGEMIFKCEGDKYFVDMSNMLPAGTMEAYQDMEVEMETQYLEFPAHPVAGQTLPDGSLTMLIKSGGMTFMTMTVFVTNRKIEGFETITTAAGTFDCVKISQTTEVKTIVKVTSHSTSWISKDIGNVRTEDYNDKGKLRSVSELTGVKR